MGCPPDAAHRRDGRACSARRCGTSTTAISQLGDRPRRRDRGRGRRDRARSARLEHAYYAGMAALLEVEDMRERIARRELYRRCSRIGETVVDVAERVVYAVVKQS